MSENKAGYVYGCRDQEIEALRIMVRALSNKLNDCRCMVLAKPWKLDREANKLLAQAGVLVNEANSMPFIR
jgi:hypothetical protein